MPWTSAAPMGGFTAAPDAWLPMDPAHLPLAIERQEANPDSALQFSRRLIAARKASSALQVGVALPLTAPDNVLAYERVVEGECVYCYFELGGEAASLAGPEFDGAQALLLEGGASLGESGLELAPYASAVVRLKC
jgi:alpha-glucosidase